VVALAYRASYGNGVIVLSGGEYDVWRRNELRTELEAAKISGEVTIDLSCVTFMDAGAVGLLLAFRKRVYEYDPKATVTLLNTPQIVRRVLSIAHADELFDFSP
jgi:anti-anti-sigma factor